MYYLPKSTPARVRRRLEALQERRDGSSHADIWTEIVEELDGLGCTLERPFPPDDEVRMG